MRRVYVIGTVDGAQHKIGVSLAPEERMAYLQPGSAARLVLVRTWDREDAYRVERAAHRVLIGRAIHGEWFAVTAGEAVAAVEQAIVAPPRPKSKSARARALLPTKTLQQVYDEAVAEHGEAAVLADIATAMKMSRSSIHKWFPGGTPGITDDPGETGK